jgi:hypothetical protein
VLDSYFTSPEGRQAMADAVAATSLGATTQVGTTSRDTFASSIEGYLESRPGSVFTWSAGHALGQLIAGKELEHLSSVWTGSDLNPRLRRLSSDAQGLPLFMPFWYDPWAFFYSRSEWVDAGYSAPANTDELINLSRAMATDGVAALGLSRLSTPALLSLYDYIGLSLNGVAVHRDLVQASSANDSDSRKAVLDVVSALSEIERGMDSEGAVSIVPAPLSQAATRPNQAEDLGVFVLGAGAVVAEVEGFALALPTAEHSSAAALELLTRLAKVGPQNAFLGEDSAKLPANLNATYGAMSATSLRVVELIEVANDIVESVAAGPEAVVTELSTELIAIVRS